LTYLFLALTAFLGLVLQGTLFSGPLSQYLRPDCVLAVTLYSGFHLRRLPGLALVSVVGCLADALSGMPDGWAWLFALATYGLAQWLRSQLLATGTWTLTITALFFAAMRDPLFLAVMRAAGRHISGSPAALLRSATEAASTVAITIALTRLMGWLRGKDLTFPPGRDRRPLPT
jgi:type IV secretory pathway TrbD component